MDALVEAVPPFRSPAQFRLLGELFTVPAERTIGDLVERTALPQATVSREIRRLVEAGLVRSRKEGNRTVVAAALDTSLSGDLRSLLMKLYGPLHQMEAVFGDLDVESVTVYGSWAAMWHGQPGPPPNESWTRCPS